MLTVNSLPDSGIAASAEFFKLYLDQAAALLSAAETEALVIILPAAGKDHDDWRRSLARDLAREYTPKRANVIGAARVGAGVDAIISYLKDAPGVTGQYLPAHG
ncbi:hypothetical protein FGU71_00750 [Erythrobacter insulae]|uniref:Short chain dehydrogenase-like proteobacteria domain-containing protein n=1 Tax=Erythrobacter insulae TaxID=2584124 RepID=A0A547P8V4_9SPHN|nr:hypothetical protein [Erythrobacter insulae]TRD10537.1 hypothetical protein FGU71_00750 [Erythrobacter insulae]